jgi:hypothetical protein
MVKLLTAITAFCPFDFAIEVGLRRIPALLVALAGLLPEHFRSDEEAKKTWHEAQKGKI